MIDCHTHIMFQVDDGSKDLETSIELIKMEIEQGVTDIVLTPHVQSTVTKADHQTHIKHFEMIEQACQDEGLKINLYLGAEIMYRSHLIPEYDLYTFGKHKYLLMEFPTQIETPIEEVCFNLMRGGYQVIVAHVERYKYLSFDDILAVKRTGALIQTNAAAILGEDRLADQKMVKKLIKNDVIDVIASDTHSIHRRPPLLLKAKEALKKHYNKEKLEQLFAAIEF